MTHRFQYITADELEGATPERLTTLELIDHCLAETPLPPETLFAYGDDPMGDVSLRCMLGLHRRINALADQVHADDRYSHFTFEELRDMSEPALQSMLAGRDPMDWREVAKRKYVAPANVKTTRAGPKQRAQIWANGTVVYLGQFDTIEERDAAVEAAKMRRSIGLPVKL
jgi:hypothetical protein